MNRYNGFQGVVNRLYGFLPKNTNVATTPPPLKLDGVVVALFLILKIKKKFIKNFAFFL